MKNCIDPLDLPTIYDIKRIHALNILENAHISPKMKSVVKTHIDQPLASEY
jgi:hypothetical protein